MANNNNGNYIKQMINRFGENWIVGLRPEDIQRNTKRIIREMVTGKIDYQEVGSYFLDPKFLDNLIIAVNNELEINTLYYNAVSFYRQYYPDIPNIGIHENHLNALCYVYYVISSKFTCLKQSGNIGYLADTSAILFNYRNHLN